MPDSRTHARPVISPLPFSRCDPANTGASPTSSHGTMTVTPVRTGPEPTTRGPSPSIKVACPTRTPSTSVMAFDVPVDPLPIETPSSLARIACSLRSSRLNGRKASGRLLRRRRSGPDDDRSPDAQQRPKASERSVRDAHAPCAGGSADGRGIVRPMDRQLIPAGPSGRQARLDAGQAEGEPPEVAAGREPHPVGHEVPSPRRRGRWRTGGRRRAKQNAATPPNHEHMA